MRTPILLLLAIAAPAAAQPVTQPTPCEVTISRAPDEVRAAIEQWVAAEPRCTTTLDVRVIPTAEGLYLFARDGAGRIRERVVPDAQSAGVLVASWVADDLIAPPSTTLPPVEATLPRELPPSATPPTQVDAPIDGPPARAGDSPGKWLTLGGIVQMHGSGAAGLRGELDVARRGRWTLAAVLAGSSADLDVAGDRFETSGYIETVDVRLLGALARTTSYGRWSMRLSFGAGVMTTRASGEIGGERIAAQGVFPTAEASILFARELRGKWAFAAGPVVTWYSQTYKLDTDMTVLQRRDLEVMAFGGLRRRL